MVHPPLRNCKSDEPWSEVCIQHHIYIHCYHDLAGANVILLIEEEKGKAYEFVFSGLRDEKHRWQSCELQL